MKIKMGMRVKTKVKKMAYYNEAIIEKGNIGEVGAVYCPNVRTPGHFHCVDFMRDGKQVRTAYKTSELIVAQD